MTEPVSPDRFQRLLQAYGASPHRWPDEERPHALAALRLLPDAALRMEDAGAIDDLLGAYRIEAPSPALAAAVLAGAPGRHGLSSVRASRLRLGWAALACALAGGIGVVAGTAAPAFVAPAALTAPPWERDGTAFGALTAEET